MMRAYDVVPASLGLVSGVVAAGEIPGPSKEEWSSVAVGVIMLLVRELVWWLRNRKRSEQSSVRMDAGGQS